MKFSIVVPLYNKASYLPATMASVALQRFSDYEVIVVDDGSTDGGPELLRNSPLPALRLVSQANAGVAVARNRGIAEAQGEWVAFLDADDWWHPDYLATLVQLMTARPHAEMVATGYRNVDHSPDTAFAAWPAEAATLQCIDNLYRDWFHRQLFFTSSLAIKRTLLNALQPAFVAGESNGEDLDVWFRCAERTTVAYSASELVVRLLVPNNLSNSAALLKEAPYLTRLELRAQGSEMALSLRQSALNFVSNNRISMARRHLGLGRRSEALHWLMKGRRACNPVRWCMTLLLICLPSGVARHWARARSTPRAA